MGNKTTKEFAQRIATEAVNEIATTATTNNVSKLDVSVSNFNEISVINSKCGKVNIDQLINSDVTILQNITNDTAQSISAQISAELENKMSAAIKTLTDKITELIPSGKSDDISIKQEILNRVVNIIRNNMTVSNITESQGYVVNQNKITFQGLEANECNITQKIFNKLKTEQLVKNTVKMIVDDEILNKIWNDNELDYEEKSGIAEVLKYVAIIIGLVIIFKVVSAFGGGGRSSGGGGIVKKLIIGLIITVIGYLLTAYWTKKFWPFKKKEGYSSEYGGSAMTFRNYKVNKSMNGACKNVIPQDLYYIDDSYAEDWDDDE